MLFISETQELEVKVEGEMELNYDFAYVNNKPFTGVINEVYRIQTDRVNILFKSDGTLVFKGVNVTIKAISYSI